jgi:hypothetical protein
MYEALALFYAEHRTFLVLVLSYILTGGLLLTIMHRPWPVRIVNLTFLTIWLACSGIWLAWQYLRSPRRLKAALTVDRVLGAVALLILVVPGQITFQALKQSLGPVVGFFADPVLHHIDVRLHGQMAWLWLEPLLAYPSVVRTLDWLYLLWFVGLLVFVVWASWTRHRAIRQRALIAFVLMWIGAGTVAAAATASVGPCFYGRAVSGPDPYVGLFARLDAVRDSQGRILKERAAQEGLWTTRQADEWQTFGGISAMPSLHVGIAVLFMMVGWRVSRVAGTFLAVYAVVIQIASVLLGWHYAIDGYAGALCAFIAWHVAGLLANADKRRALRSSTSAIGARCAPVEAAALGTPRSSS